ncbi:MAG: enoyl-CoA hydratase/isomerase family protein [Pseudomonadales bacterium]|jgi:enoyl-CoA hydratase|nr:enoyl-CoA hydratase/isomerase family protein [Pseudomonadales bacterium]MDP6470286.1 enoyl-CoA hydratase/isomerase family protein [Pseudomonadales bacterium]MDP6827192.1 enoyl-CoA hydratase/isomerase family protein [Pseudomonadales bacterium]MDP6972505.1 enoyl-CoA hydratase/isomerase family protein [Pseudomonadales bacterium]|tara:strand:+ start:245 stop:949 length:705 start_codon:yes stop_codon:yes gene_type:complete
MSDTVNGPVEVQRHDGWAEVVLNRPERKNAITGPLGVALSAAIEGCDADEGIRAIVLRGADGSFCSGLDLKEFNAQPSPEWLPDFQRTWRGVHRALFDCSTPIVGALERFAINGGAALALACDLLVAGEGAFLQVGEVQLGMAAPYNVAWLNLRVSEVIAARIVLLGERLYAEQLRALQLVERIVPDDAVVEEGRQLAEQIAAYPEGVARIKASLRSRCDDDADAWFDRVVTVR